MPASTNKEMRQKDVVYDKKTQRKRSFHYKLEDVVAALATNYVGQHMINQFPTLTNDMVWSNVCDEAFKRMKLSLERGDVENFEEKWSKMFGIRQAYWKHPRGSKYARRNGFPKE
jgi:hypothetical protein